MSEVSSRHGRRSVFVPVVYHLLEAWNTLLPLIMHFRAIREARFGDVCCDWGIHSDKGGLPPTLQIRGYSFYGCLIAIQNHLMLPTAYKGTLNVSNTRLVYRRPGDATPTNSAFNGCM